MTDSMHITCQDPKVQEIINSGIVKTIGTEKFREMLPLYLENILIALRNDKDINPGFPLMAITRLNDTSGCPKEHLGYLKEVLKLMHRNRVIIMRENVTVHNCRMAFVRLA